MLHVASYDIFTRNTVVAFINEKISATNFTRTDKREIEQYLTGVAKID